MSVFMGLKRGVLLAMAAFLFMRLVSLGSALYQNAGYTALNSSRAQAQSLPSGAEPDYSLAASLFATAVEARTTHSSARGLGFALLYAGREEAALQAWAAAPVTMQDELVAYGDLAMAAGGYETAVAWYEKALTLNQRPPICPLAHRLGQAYEAAGQPVLARQQFLRCVQSAESYADATVDLCFSYVNSGELDAAVALLASLEEASRQNSSLLTCVGIGHMEARAYGEAVTYFKEAVAVDPERASLYQWLSLAYTRVGMLDEAIASAEQATTLDGSKVDYWRHLANLYRDTGQDEAATAVMQTIANLEP
jgi:tetratricopeptide (TPR) repeat protein